MCSKENGDALKRTAQKRSGSDQKMGCSCKESVVEKVAEKKILKIFDRNLI